MSDDSAVQHPSPNKKSTVVLRSVHASSEERKYMQATDDEYIIVKFQYLNKKTTKKKKKKKKTTTNYQMDKDCFSSLGNPLKCTGILINEALQ